MIGRIIAAILLAVVVLFGLFLAALGVVTLIALYKDQIFILPSEDDSDNQSTI